MKHISPGISVSNIASPTTASINISSSIVMYGSLVTSGSIDISGSITVSDTINVNDINFTHGANFTSSWADNAVSSSYALTASYALNSSGSGVATLIDTLGTRVYTEDTYITAGSKGYRHIAYDADIIKTVAIANTNGYIDVNVKRNGTTLGTVSLSNQSSSLDTTLAGWTTQLNTNDLIEFYVSQSSTYITDITIFIDIQSR